MRFPKRAEDRAQGDPRRHRRMDQHRGRRRRLFLMLMQVLSEICFLSEICMKSRDLGEICMKSRDLSEIWLLARDLVLVVE